MRFIFLRGFSLLLLFLATGVGAETVEKRVLFVVETSKETKALAHAERQLVGALVETGLGGLLDTNDTFGVWTFSDTLQYGKFPVQRWSAERSKELASQVEAFLKAQPYDKLPKVNALKEPLGKVVSSSPALMVVMVTSGKHPISGTPFDAEISQALRTSYRDYQKQKTPAVVMLSATSGKILRYSVSPAIGDVRIPLLTLPTNVVVKATPTAPKPSKKAEPKVAAPAAPPEPKRAPKALVITKDGPQSMAPEEADKIVAAIPPPPVATPREPVLPSLPVEKLPSGPVIISSEEKIERVTIKPIIPRIPEAVEAPAAVPVAEQLQPDAAPSVQETPPAPVPAVVVEPVKSEPVGKAEPQPAPNAPVAAPEKIIAQAPPAPVPAEQEPAPEPARIAAVLPEPPPSLAKAAPKDVVAPAPKPEPAPAAAPAAAPLAAAPVPAPPTAPPSSENDNVTKTTAPLNTPQPLVAQTVPVRSSFPFLWVAGGLLVVAVILAFLIRRFWSNKPQQSLVSDWAERERTQK